VAAARRSEQRKLLCFVKMADYMICDTLHEARAYTRQLFSST
jgi:dynein heavy chain